jgi:CheY-like chemotaxis protein
MGTSVLIVDDDDATREALCGMLTDAGYTVYEAPDGESALQRLREHPAGMVVLLDMIMPGMDGITMLEAVETESPLATRDAYIVMSARFTTVPLPLAQQLMRLGATAITKPFDMDELLARVAAAAQCLARDAE